MRALRSKVTYAPTASLCCGAGWKAHSRPWGRGRKRHPIRSSLAQIFRYFLKRGVKPLTKNNAVAILLDERVSAEIVLVDRTQARFVDRVAQLARARAQSAFVRRAHLNLL